MLTIETVLSWSLRPKSLQTHKLYETNSLKCYRWKQSSSGILNQRATNYQKTNANDENNPLLEFKAKELVNPQDVWKKLFSMLHDWKKSLSEIEGQIACKTHKVWHASE